MPITINFHLYHYNNTKNFRVYSYKIGKSEFKVYIPIEGPDPGPVLDMTLSAPEEK